MTASNTHELELTAQLADATTAARNAFRDTARLIRLLSVLSRPSAPDELLDGALGVLSEVFIADVVCVVGVLTDGFVVTSASGLGDEDISFMEGWSLGPAAAEATRKGRAVARQVDDDDADVPPSLADLHIRSAAFVPMSTDPGRTDELLVIYRSSGEPFGGTDLHVLASVAQRLSVAAENRERAVAIERLAETGHQLTRHLDPGSLADKAAELLRLVTMSDSAWVVAVQAGRAYHGSRRGSSGRALAVVGRPVEELFGWHEAEKGRPWIGTMATDGGPTSRTVLCVPVLRDGVPIALLYAARDRPRPFSNEVVEITTIFATYLGTAMENAAQYHELRHRATRDPLTGLANRDLAGQRLDELLRNGSSFVGLLFCDLDGFKAVNDRLGHDAGDELLQQVAVRLQRGVRPDDLLARFGGDEFVVVLGAVESHADVVEVGRRVVRALEEPFTLDEERVSVSASIGGALGAQGGTSSSAMLRDADAAMYVAKSRGPGAVEVFDDAASYRSLDRLSIRSELLRAMDRNEFEVRYQPIVELATGRPVAFEALLRWTHPQRGAIPPDTFIPLAEETGQIVPLGKWVMEQACRQLAAWQHLPGQRDLRLHVNVSATQLWQDDAAAQIFALMREAGVDPADVWLEVTEKTHAGDDVTVVTQDLRGGGVHFALDDFGSSYCNLTYLKQFPTDCLKIDGSFIGGVATEPTDQSIVRAILAIAESLKLEVVAEGIERPAEREALLAMGCNLGQGFLFESALPADEATRMLADHTRLGATVTANEPVRAAEGMSRSRG